MIRLPEKIRSSLDRVVRNLKTRETISSIGLFGSWSRGDADPSSDVDLLIIDNRPFDYEYVERLEQNGTLIDLNYVPQKWLSDFVPPEVDQKIHEAYVLYDREWMLTDAKEHVMNAFYTPERLGIRTEGYLVDADIYLSRATSAQARGDSESAQTFATLSAQTILKTIIEIAKLPLTSSHYLKTLERATKQLNMTPMFTNYLSHARLENLSPNHVEEKLSGFKAVWNEIFFLTRANTHLLSSMHFKVRTKLNYYAATAFLQGMILRSQTLLNGDLPQETRHYIFTVLMDMLENYAWLKAAEQRMRMDYTTLLRSLKGPERKPATIYSNAKKALNIENVDENDAGKTIAAVKRTVLEVRQQRKILLDELQKETY